MQTPASPLSVNEFILECSELWLRLDPASNRLGQQIVVLSLDSALRSYEMLLRKRVALPTTPDDAPLVSDVLDGLLERLQLLGAHA